jgi:hypothetical protein
MYVSASNSSASAAQLQVGSGTNRVSVTVPARGSAEAPNVTPDASTGTISICGTSVDASGAMASGCAPVMPEDERYCDPYRDCSPLVPERVDQGVDYGCGCPIYALGPGTVDLYANFSDAGWPGPGCGPGSFISYTLTAGPAAGKTIYLAENVGLAPNLAVGAFVYSGTVLGTQVDAQPESESGWGHSAGGAPLAADYGGFPCTTCDCDSTALGSNFNDLLVSLGTVSGIVTTGDLQGTMPTGWPTDWPTLLATWQ